MNIFEAKDLTHSKDISCDVCIIGSGAGGSPLAAGLVEKGLNVVMLEAGSYQTAKNFRMNEAEALRNLYQEGGLRATSDLGITILQGKSVGGSTTINWTTCFRTPEKILTLWQKRFGLFPLTSEELSPYFQEVERRLNIRPWSEEAANANNKVLLRGCKTLGWESSVLKRNVNGCANSGYCGMGCPINAKQGMLTTYLPEALNGGMRLFCNTRADRVESSTTRAERILASVIDPKTNRPTGVRLNIKSKVIVSACGAINGPALFLRSGLNDKNLVGKRTFIHPVVAIAAQFDEPINGFHGAPQSISSHQFINRGADKIGFFMETAPIHSILTSSSVPTFGKDKMQFMSQLNHMSVLIAIHSDGVHPDDVGGTVSITSSGRPKIDYPISPLLKEAFREAHKTLGTLGLAAGAKRCYSLHTNPVSIEKNDDISLFEQQKYGSLEHIIFSAHQMGGLPMGKDPNQSVVNSDLRHHSIENLFVVDGSVFPTSLGVNPSQTIYTLSLRAVNTIANLF
ncbi:MAG: GMC family oxidoreductase [Myxococcota bacterium]|nr:GMC family oxidoreductase [Myxococcota bacterium]